MAHDARVEEVIARLAGERRVAVAESCTGGALAARLVSVSGSSRYFPGGVVAYANEAKRDLLGVPEEVLRTRGAVSEECALAMARGAARLLGAQVAVSTTGIAGPEGGTPLKPVGLVYVALVAPDNPAATICTRNVWPGDRARNIELSVAEGLRLLRAYFESHPR